MDAGREIDKLYDLEPEGFVTARDALAKKLRDAGRADDAAEVRALRRPTVAAWALNRLAREQEKQLAELFEVARDLRVAQRGALSGLKGGPLREAAKRRRSVVDRLADAAEDILEASGRSGSHREAITRTLESAIGDDEAAEALRTGRLEKEIDRPPGFGDLTGLAPVPTGKDAGARNAKPAKAAAKEDPRARRIRTQRDEAADDARRASREAVAAGERAVRAEKEAEAAARAIEGLERDLRAARRREREAVEAARDATAGVKKSEAAAERARTRVEDLQARLEKLIRG